MGKQIYFLHSSLFSLLRRTREFKQAIRYPCRALWHIWLSFRLQGLPSVQSLHLIPLLTDLPPANLTFRQLPKLLSTAVHSPSSHLNTLFVPAMPMEQVQSMISPISFPGSSTSSFLCSSALPYQLYRQHNNTHPTTKEPLNPADLISLNYSRKDSGEIHDPISFKPFSEHSHIVAIATTGNVFLAESIKGNKDLLTDTPFKKCAQCSY